MLNKSYQFEFWAVAPMTHLLRQLYTPWEYGLTRGRPSVPVWRKIGKAADVAVNGWNGLLPVMIDNYIQPAPTSEEKKEAWDLIIKEVRKVLELD
jgi:hypothetical protein